ncbi:MAG: lysophospholipid acyltransferase family protein [Candidatus Omnitrophica bacterium]|nr:lysophospholipid acyltransferase family protein [Candidatus Omnitrophota bacterium]
MADIAYHYFMFKKVFLSVIIWVIGTTLTILLYFAMLFTVVLFPFDKMRRKAHAQCFWWARSVVGLNPYWNITVSGLENIDKNKTYVIVANHQSLADIVIIYLAGMQFKWVAKESLFKLPFVGWCMSIAKHIKLERGAFGSIKKVYREAAHLLRGGMSVLFFPEGTRSNASEMKEFQNGAFKLAIKEKVPVLPIAIKGTGDAIPKGTWLFESKIPGSLKVLPAIDTSSFTAADFAKLRDMARTELESA